MRRDETGWNKRKRDGSVWDVINHNSSKKPASNTLLMDFSPCTQSIIRMSQHVAFFTQGVKVRCRKRERHWLQRNYASIWPCMTKRKYKAKASLQNISVCMTRSPLAVRGGTPTRHERAAEIEPSIRRLLFNSQALPIRKLRDHDIPVLTSALQPFCSSSLCHNAAILVTPASVRGLGQSDAECLE